MPIAPPDPLPVERRHVTIEGRHGAVMARAYASVEGSSAVGMVWAHGGGFVAGDLDMPEAEWVATQLATRGFPVLSIDYRKCLEGLHFPVPSDDVLDAWLWAVDHAGDLGVDPQRLHLGGASAGAALVAGVAKRLRDGAGPPPASVILVYPIVHAELPPLSDRLRATLEEHGDAFFTPELVHRMNRYSGTEAALTSPYAFAANGDLSGQPPVFVLNSEADVLRASGEAYAARLEAAGVPVRLEYEPGSAHGHLNEPAAPEAIRSIERLAGWLARP